MEFKEKRRAKRLPFRANVTYEIVTEEGTTEAPVIASAYNIGIAGMSLYSPQPLEINTKVKLTFMITSAETASFFGRIVRLNRSESDSINYQIGVSFDNIDAEQVGRVEAFMTSLDISRLLDSLNLDNVIDVNMISGFPPVMKRLKKLVITRGEPQDEYILRQMLISFLDDAQYEKLMTTREFNCIMTTRKGTRFRVNLHFQQGKLEGTFRVIPGKINAPSELGLPKVSEQLLMERNGLILVAGSTGSGKTTTLASMVEYLNNLRTGIIICIEDPIEYLHNNRLCIIKQRELGRDTLSFYNAARNALRQNPDVLVVGEILDRETMETAITAAETGALVLTSIHAGDVAQTLDRVSSFFPPDVQPYILKRLSLVLRGVLAQELIPRQDDEGLVMAAEVMTVNSAVRRAIREADWKQIPSFIQVGKQQGMQTMQNSLRELVNRNLISPEYLMDDLM